MTNFFEKYTPMLIKQHYFKKRLWEHGEPPPPACAWKNQ